MSDSGDLPTFIFGGGLTGISAALHMTGPYWLVERDARLGGLARTVEREGFYFDHTGHWLHLRDEQMQGLAARLLGERMVEVERRARIFSHGRQTLYPFQANLHGLPAEVVYECLLGFVRTFTGPAGPSGDARLVSEANRERLEAEAIEQRGGDEPSNFEQYILHHFGEGIAKHFMIPYNHKLWGVHPREITSAWCQRFVPVPTVEQVIAGSVGAGPARLGYNTSFMYPRQGGIETFTRGLIGELDSQRTVLETSLEAIDPVGKTVRYGGQTRPYHAVISSLPLPRLIDLVVDAPEEILLAASRLRATPVRYLNVGVKAAPPADYHWVYVPEERFPFYRVGIFSNAVPSMAPQGCSSLYVELASRSGASDETVRQALAGLVEIDAIARVEDVAFADLQEIDPAYVVFDDHYEQAVGTLHSFLEQHRIYSRGRYGAWIYNSMEDSLLAGKQVAGLVAGLDAAPSR